MISLGHAEQEPSGDVVHYHIIIEVAKRKIQAQKLLPTLRPCQSYQTCSSYVPTKCHGEHCGVLQTIHHASLEQTRKRNDNLQLFQNTLVKDLATNRTC